MPSDPQESARKPSRREQLWVLAQSPFGIWVLSTVVVGLFGWSYAQISSELSHSRVRATLVKHADAEAKSRLRQWVGISRARAVRRTFWSDFQTFYLGLIETPQNHATSGYVVYPAYPEFANSALISVLVQLRDTVPAEETVDIDRAIAWVGLWNSDMWVDKSFNQAVATVIENLWLARWGPKPTIPDLFNIRVGRGMINSELIFLSAVNPNDDSRLDKDGLFVFSADDHSGRQEWEIEHGTGGFSRIRLASGISTKGDFLSSTTGGEKVDLYYVDDKSGRQRWIIEDAPGGLEHIRVYDGVYSKLRYLSTSPDGSRLSLVEGDDGSGRQRWKIERIK
jgi:hypothetical protein